MFPSYHPSGARLALNDQTAGNLHNSVLVRNADGSGQRRLFTDAERSALAPSWSPGGDRIAFGLREYYHQSGNADDVLISVPKGGYVPEFAERELLTQKQNPLRLSVLPPDGADVESFVVSPDGRRIAFAARVNGRLTLRATLS